MSRCRSSWGSSSSANRSWLNSVKAVQRALGHASAATTLNLYAHMWPGDDDRIRQAVDRAFGSDAEDQLRTGTGAE